VFTIILHPQLIDYKLSRTLTRPTKNVVVCLDIEQTYSTIRLGVVGETGNVGIPIDAFQNRTSLRGLSHFSFSLSSVTLPNFSRRVNPLSIGGDSIFLGQHFAMLPAIWADFVADMLIAQIGSAAVAQIQDCDFGVHRFPFLSLISALYHTIFNRQAKNPKNFCEQISCQKFFCCFGTRFARANIMPKNIDDIENQSQREPIGFGTPFAGWLSSYVNRPVRPVQMYTPTIVG
jgi:hypothetical protein